MKQEDINRRCVVFDRPKGQGNGLVGTIIEVYNEYLFRFITDTGNEYEFSTSGEMGVKVQFLGDA